MRFLILALFIGVLARHSVPNWIWQGTGISQSGWLYIFGGLLEVLFCLALAYAAKNVKRLTQEWASMDKTERRLWALVFSYAIIIGVLEGGQMSVCRLAVANFGDVPKGVNLCDFAIVANWNYLVAKSPALSWMRLNIDRVPFTEAVYTTYFISFIYHYAKILRGARWKKT